MLYYLVFLSISPLVTLPCSTVADSACSSTAYLGGVKGPISTIGGAMYHRETQ